MKFYGENDPLPEWQRATVLTWLPKVWILGIPPLLACACSLLGPQLLWPGYKKRDIFTMDNIGMAQLVGIPIFPQLLRVWSLGSLPTHAGGFLSMTKVHSHVCWVCYGSSPSVGTLKNTFSGGNKHLVPHFIIICDKKKKPLFLDLWCIR